MKGRLFLAFFGVFWSAITLLFDGFLVVPAVRQAMATGYPSTEGTIISSRVTQGNGGEDGPSYEHCESAAQPRPRAPVNSFASGPA